MAAVRKSVGHDVDVLEDGVIERPYGWVFFVQTRDYIETKDPELAAYGAGGTLVERISGRLFSFGSCFSIEENLHIYEAGYLTYECSDLVVRAVFDLEEAARLIAELGLTYTSAEVEHGTKWRVPTAYSAAQLINRLRTLPCRFNMGSLYFKWHALDRMKASACLQYEITQSKGEPNAPA